MGGAGEAGIEAADARLDPVEQGLRDGGRHRIGQDLPRDLQHGAVHGQVVLARGDDQVHAGDQALLVHPVVVEQGAPRRLAHPHRLMGIEGGAGPHVGVLQLVVVQ